VSERTLDLDVPERALVIVAHPDDAEFQAGATLAKWSRRGSTVHHLVLTDGSKGTWDAHVDQAALVLRRQQEQRDAARALGATGEVVFLGEVDGELGTGTELRGRVAEVIRRLRPNVVLGHDPWKRYRLHPDHHAAGRLCVDGIVAARDPFFHPEQLRDGLAPHRPDALLLFEADVDDHAEVVDEADVSQMETTHFYRVGEGDALAGFRRRERERLEAGGAWAGVPLAERYHLIVDQL
jgi:LmbE family N-acetylglucosaminyl deacetylase